MPEAEVFGRLIGIHPKSSSEDLALYIRLVVFLELPHQRGEINLFKTNVSRKEFQEHHPAIFENYFSKEDIARLEDAVFAE